MSGKSLRNLVTTNSTVGPVTDEDYWCITPTVLVFTGVGVWVGRLYHSLSCKESPPLLFYLVVFRLPPLGESVKYSPFRTFVRTSQGIDGRGPGRT